MAKIILKWQRRHLRSVMTPFLTQFISMLEKTLETTNETRVIFNFSSNSYGKKGEVWEGSLYVYVPEHLVDGRFDMPQMLKTLSSLFGSVHMDKFHPEAVPSSTFDPKTKVLVVQPGWTLTQRRAYIEMYVQKIVDDLQIDDPNNPGILRASGDFMLLYSNVQDEKEGKYDRLSAADIRGLSGGQDSGAHAYGPDRGTTLPRHLPSSSELPSA